jgi:hypothetical protein
LSAAFLGAAFSAGASAFVTALAGFEGLDLPKDPAKIFPFLVFISPRPIVIYFYVLKKSKIQPHLAFSMPSKKLDFRR